MKLLRQLISAVALLILASAAVSQSVDSKTFHNIPDDGYVIVPIPFGFPFYGRLFTHSIMFDNGVVSFYDPTTEAARLGGQQFNALPLSNNIGSNFHYSIMPLWTDLVGNVNSKFYTQTDSATYLKYSWENVQQWGNPSRLNSFNLEIRPTGFFGITYDKVNISGYPVTIGHVGNATAGEWSQIYHQPTGGSTTLSNLQNWSVGSAGPDCSNPLNDSLCPGYATAYFTQQCSISALYDPACPGYSVAFLNQQCSISSLYSPACPGYATAYLEQQCSLDPLYSTTCDGYDTAYFNQQCGLDPLYNDQCPGYDDAFYVMQCTLSPLYDRGCTGYAEAFAKKYILAESKSTSDPVVEVVSSTVEETVATVVTGAAAAPAASSSPADSATAPVQLTAAPAATVAQSAATAPSRTEPAAAPAPRTTRQVLAEQRAAATRERAAKAAQENPDAVAAEMDSAGSFEQQAEIQNVVLGALGFVPGFDAYGRVTIPDAAGYPPFVIYPGQRNIDSPAARGLLGRSDRLHQEMVDAQYR